MPGEERILFLPPPISIPFHLELIQSFVYREDTVPQFLHLRGKCIYIMGSESRNGAINIILEFQIFMTLSPFLS